LIRQLWLDNTLFGQVFSLERRKESSTLVLGGGWNTYGGDHFGKITWTQADPALRKTWYDYDARKTDLNLYAKYQKALGKNWQAFADLQYRFVDYDINGFRNNPGVQVNEQYNFVNPKAGLSYAKNLWSGFFSYAMGQKEPNRDDFEAGINQLPNPEQLHDFELNITRKNLLPGLTGSLTGFFMLYRNQLVLTGQINDVGAYARTNLPKSYRAGGELEANYRSKIWQLNYSLSLSANKAKDFVEYMDDYDNGGQVTVKRGTTNIALSPSVVQNFSLGVLPLKGLDLTWLGKHVGEQFLDNSSDAGRKLNAFFVNDLRMSYTFNVGFVKEIRLVAQANNLFDIQYEPNGYTFSYIYGGQTVTENYYYPMAGRNYMMALNIKL
jgi:iron complex outermembrane receptor protein